MSKIFIMLYNIKLKSTFKNTNVEPLLELQNFTPMILSYFCNTDFRYEFSSLTVLIFIPGLTNAIEPAFDNREVNQINNITEDTEVKFLCPNVGLDAVYKWYFMYKDERNQSQYVLAAMQFQGTDMVYNRFNLPQLV